MKDTTKTIIIGSLITILVLTLTIFILYKIDSKKLNNENSTNKNEYNNSTPATNTSNNESNSNNTTNNNDNNEAPSNNKETNTPIKDDEKNEKVILYLFHGATCPACNNALKAIKEARNTTFNNIEIRTYEVWNNKDNNKLMSKVTEKLKVNVNSIPYFIIGDYNRVGFNSETLLKEYKNALNNKNYKDIVEEVIKENPDLKPVYETI